MRPTLHRLPTLCIAALCALAALTSAPERAEAFCGFYVSDADQKLYNNATQVVLMRDGTRTVLSMRNTYQGPTDDFAMVVPVPVILKEENVKTLPDLLFDDVDRMASPRLVEYWERDPCKPEPPVEYRMRTTAVEDDGGDFLDEEETEEEVVVEAEFEVGEYEVVVLSAKESNALDRWLRQNKYNIPDGAGPVLKPYVENGMYFFVAKVNADKVTFKDGQAVLSPLRFHYDSDTFSLPVRLGLLNANGAQDLIVHILARGQRYELANLPNATIPTNIEVANEVRNRFGEFYAALFDKTLEKNPGAVVTEYSWDASTCDPCPGPTLTGNHFLTLGADVIEGEPQYGFVLTRLHARYTKDQLKDDLVFKAVGPIAGGREVRGPNNEGLERGAVNSSVNNFQGRYIIRHPWDGPITCANPIRGVWGGPPNGASAATGAAQNTASAPRGALDLAAHLVDDVPPLELVGQAKPTPISKAASGPMQLPPRPEPPTTPALPPQAGGCASCAVAGSTQTPWWAGLLATLAGALVLARRRRRN